MKKTTNDFTQGNIVGKLINFMLPILGALILQAMYSAVDILVVGQFGTTAGISGVSTGSSVVNIFGDLLFVAVLKMNAAFYMICTRKMKRVCKNK